MEIPKDIIVPPADVREVIDKTAGYIHRNGKSFEQRMKERQAQNNQFQFLYDHDAYYGYYKWKLDNFDESENTKSNSQADQPIGNDPKPTSTTESSTVPPPKELEFHFDDLIPMSSFDFDVIKMTLGLVAKNGGLPYIAKLLEERKDLPLDFLNETHSLNKIFKHFVTQFSKIITPSEQLVNKIDLKLKNPYSVLEDLYHRLEYTYQEEKLRKAKQNEQAKKNLEYASIDWTDFVVVETIEFDELDQVTEFPIPLSLNDLQYRSLAQKKLNSLIEEAAPDDEDIPKYEKEDEDDAEDEESPAPTAAVPSSVPSRPSRPVPKGMKIRPVGAGRSESPSTVEERLVRSPFSNQMIPESKLKQHIDIAFRDPRYLEEKRRYELKVKNTNPTSTDDVLDNIKSILHRKRANGSEDVDQDVKKQKVQWDGYKGSASYVVNEVNKNLSKEEIEEFKKRQIEERNKIGPGPVQGQRK